MCEPDYNGRGIVNLMASLQAGLRGEEAAYPGCDLLPAAWVADHRKVILVVIDGLGYDYLRAHPEAAWLNAHCAGDLSTVYPPTTASAITTFLTGDAPRQHGMVGWFQRFAAFPEVFALLPGYPRGGGEPLAARVGDLRTFLEHRPFSERLGVPAHLVSPAHIADSPYNRAHLGSAALQPYEGLEGLVSRCREIARRPDAAYVYAYWHRLDQIGHEVGMHGPVAAAHLAEIDAALAGLAEDLRGTGSLLLVAADHGHLDTVPGRRLELNRYPDLLDCLDGPMSGEPRTAYCHVRAGQAARFERLAADLLGEVAELHRPEDLIAAGWFGPGRDHPHFRYALGDYVLLLRDGYAAYQRIQGETAHVQVGVHGGQSRAELRVPLVAAAA
jgi:hypothetical protein